MDTQTARTSGHTTIRSSSKQHNNNPSVSDHFSSMCPSLITMHCVLCVCRERVRVPQQNTTEGHGNWWVTFRVFLWRPADALGFASEPPPSIFGTCPLYRNKCDTAAGTIMFCGHGESKASFFFLWSHCSRRMKASKYKITQIKTQFELISSTSLIKKNWNTNE